MLSPLEPLFCPCCTPALLHALAQSGYQSFTQPLNLLGTGAFSQVLKLSAARAKTVRFPEQDAEADRCADVA